MPQFMARLAWQKIVRESAQVRISEGESPQRQDNINGRTIVLINAELRMASNRPVDPMKKVSRGSVSVKPPVSLRLLGQQRRSTLSKIHNCEFHRRDRRSRSRINSRVSEDEVGRWRVNLSMDRDDRGALFEHAGGVLSIGDVTYIHDALGESFGV